MERTEFAGLNREVGNRRSDHWISLWSPKSFDDVHVSKNAKLEIKAWLEEACSGHNIKPPILLVVGPTGCGKTVLINLACKLLKISIARWETPLDLVFSDATASYSESQVKKFEDFLRASARYQSIFQGLESKKVIVVEEFPQAFFQNSDALHDIIKKHVATSRTPVILACDENVEQKLFPQLFVNELKAKYLKMKPLPPRALSAVLSRVRQLYPETANASAEFIQDLAKGVNGDCRSALIGLYCHVFGAKRETEEKRRVNVVAALRKVKKGTKVKPKQMGRDNDLGTFHLLGQILYPKRKAEEDFSLELQGIFEHDPNEIAASAQRHPGIISLAHENYLSTFGDIDDVSNALYYLCDVDILNKEMQDKDNVQKIAFSLLTYGLMVSNKHVVRKWNPWRKSRRLEALSATERWNRKRLKNGGLNMMTKNDEFAFMNAEIEDSE